MHNRRPLRIKLLTSLLQIFFSLLYHQFAWTYDWVANVASIGMWKEWIMSVLPFLSGTRILEIGHGPGHLLVALHQSSRIIFGLDSSSQMSRIAYLRLVRHNFLPRLCRGETRCLPYTTNSLDHVVSTFPSEYILDPCTLSETFRVLRPGGTLIIIPYAWVTGKNPLHKASAWLFHITGESPNLNDVPLHPLLNAGFLAKAEKIALNSSMVLILQAQKPPN